MVDYLLVSGEEMRSLEEAAFSRGISAAVLMEEAGRGLAGVLRSLFPQGARLVIFAGKGHNAGDAFVAARYLLGICGWEIEVRLAFPESSLRPLAAEQWLAVKNCCGTAPSEASILRGSRPLVLLDALLGIGATPKLEGPILDACRAMNRLRLEHYATSVAVDLPTGLDATSGAADADCVVADHTITIAQPKVGLVADAAATFAGRLHVVPLADLQLREPDVHHRILTPLLLRPMLPPKRPFSMHKGQAGRVGIVAGSRGCIGAARLASAGAVYAGAGLVTLFVPEDIYEIAAASCMPEVMVRPLQEISIRPLDAFGVGPGLGAAATAEALKTLTSDPRPIVLDADALTLLATQPEPALTHPGGPRLLTPHPGEMERLQPGFSPETRANRATAYVQQFPATLLLKGSRSVIAERGRPLAYNSTGTPAMAAGGMGDVLTGLCATLLAQGVAPYNAACLGSWLLGRSAELAAGPLGRHCRPSQVLESLPEALLELALGV